MENIDVVFVVLTYRNCNDLVDFCSSVKNLSVKQKTIIVDAFYDEKSSEEIEKIARQNDCHYIRIPNKGYSYGNNVGIKYAVENYAFDYLVVSNPDIEVKKFSVELLRKLPKGCYGSKIITKDGRQQNPMYVKEHLLSRKLVYCGLKKDNKILFYLGILINKAMNFIESFLSRRNGCVYQLHGSFVIFPFEVIQELLPVYDENIFLFAEESYLAKKLQRLNIKSFYLPDIEVYHKEDGSMQFLSSISKQLKDANIYVYETYYNGR